MPISTTLRDDFSLVKDTGFLKDFGLAKTRKTPHPPLRGTFSPFKNGEKGNGGGTVPGHLLPVSTGRREMEEAPFFPLAPRCGRHRFFPSPRDSGERVPEGRVRGWSSLQRSSFSSAPLGHLPRQHGEKGNGSRVPALACPSFSSTWEAYTTSLGKTKRYPTPISVERLFEMRRVCRNW